MRNPKVDTFIYNQPKELRKILSEVRELILESAPFMEEQFKYKVPLYHCYGALAYIVPKTDKIIVGFIKGAILSETNDLLVGEQKLVRHFVITSFDNQTKEALRNLLQEAIILNEFVMKSKKRSK